MLSTNPAVEAPRTTTAISRSERLAAWAASQHQPPGSELDFHASSSMLRDLIRRGLVGMTDLREDPAWFFEAHHDPDDVFGVVVAVGRHVQRRAFAWVTRCGA